MKVLILDSPAMAVTRVDDLVADLIRRKANAALGLATGGTMVPL